MSNDKLHMTLLYDFYGELLTDKQREYFDLYHNEDLSLSEIADNVGITRQGVRDIIVRAENILSETEQKTGLVRRFEEIQTTLSKALSLTASLKLQASSQAVTEMADELISMLEGLKG